MRIKFGVKIGLIFGLLAVGMTSAGVFVFYFRTHELVIKLMADRLKDIGRTASWFFGEKERAAVGELAGILERETVDRETQVAELLKLSPGETRAGVPGQVSDRIMQTEAFQSLVQVLRRIKVSTRRRMPGFGPPERVSRGDPDPPLLRFVYILAPVSGSPDHRVLQWVADPDYDAPGEETPFGLLYRVPQESVRRAFAGGIESESAFVDDKWGPSLTAVFPLQDAAGKVAAVVGLDMDVTSEANKIRDLWVICLSVVGIAVFLSLVTTVFLAHQIKKPIDILRRGAERVRQRDFSGQIVLKNRDELGMLAETFNSMIAEIRDYAAGLERLNAAYYRFVPREFLDFLGKESIVEINLGDQIRSEMAVLFSDIRSFTTLSEQMTPSENFNFLNTYLSRISPVIRQNKGFIDKYIGDAIMALFPRRPIDAVEAAIRMRRGLRAFNADRIEAGRAPIDIGIGVHFGWLMLGTIGEAERMEGTVIADAVNLASRLEGLTKQFGVPILVSGDVFDRLPGGTHEDWFSRPLGRVRVKGKVEAVLIHEIVDKEEPNAALRQKTLADFSQGVADFIAGQRAEAAIRFRRVLDADPLDKAAAVYLDRCGAAHGGD